MRRDFWKDRLSFRKEKRKSTCKRILLVGLFLLQNHWALKTTSQKPHAFCIEEMGGGAAGMYTDDCWAEKPAQSL